MKAADPEQTPDQIAAALEAYLADFPAAAVLEDGKLLFDMRQAKYKLATEHGRCTLHLWSEDRNLVRRVSAAVLRHKILRLTSHRFGHTRTQLLEVVGDRDRRTLTARETTRTRFVHTLQRILARHLPDWRPEGFRTAMDLEKSFGPAYARGQLLRGQQLWAIIAVNREETQPTIDGILTLGILWLAECRRQAGPRRIVSGLKLVLPAGTATLTLSRLAWLHPETHPCQLLEFDERTEDLTPRDPDDHGNLASHLVHAPNLAAARERFAHAAQQVRALLPDLALPLVDEHVRSGSEMVFLLHGLEFARARLTAVAHSFDRVETLTFGAGPNETELTPENEPEIRDRLTQLFHRRTPTGDRRDPLFRMQPERWLEGALRHRIDVIDPALDPNHVYSQVPAFAAGDRGMLDLLSVSSDGRLAVIELKADEDLHLALQALDYWIRVRWHHLHNLTPHGSSDLQHHGYFTGVTLAPAAPRLYLAAPALRIHPATEVVLRALSLQVEWTLIALDERWRTHLKSVWRKTSPSL